MVHVSKFWSRTVKCDFASRTEVIFLFKKKCGRRKIRSQDTDSRIFRDNLIRLGNAFLKNMKNTIT